MPIILVHAVIWIIITLVVAYVIVLLLGQLPGLPSIIATLVWIAAVLLCLGILLNALLPGSVALR